MTNLNIFKWNSKRHLADFTRLALYFNCVWQRHNGKDTYSCPLTRLRRLVAPRNAPLVKFAASIWFYQLSRGSNLTNQVSKWGVRNHPRLNPQAIKAMLEMSAHNIDVIEEAWAVAAQKNTVEVTLKTVIAFTTPEAAQRFEALAKTLFSQPLPIGAEPDLNAWLEALHND